MLPASPFSSLPKAKNYGEVSHNPRRTGHESSPLVTSVFTGEVNVQDYAQVKFKLQTARRKFLFGFERETAEQIN